MLARMALGKPFNVSCCFRPSVLNFRQRCDSIWSWICCGNWFLVANSEADLMESLYIILQEDSLSLLIRLFNHFKHALKYTNENKTIVCTMNSEDIRSPLYGWSSAPRGWSYFQWGKMSNPSWKACKIYRKASPWGFQHAGLHNQWWSMW